MTNTKNSLSHCMIRLVIIIIITRHSTNPCSTHCIIQHITLAIGTLVTLVHEKAKQYHLKCLASGDRVLTTRNLAVCILSFSSPGLNSEYHVQLQQGWLDGTGKNGRGKQNHCIMSLVDITVVAASPIQSVCLSVYLPACMYVCMYACMSAYLS